MTTLHKEKAKVLLDLLSLDYAEEYNGPDDEMSDRCNHWISLLTEDEVKEIAAKTFREGI